MTTKRKTEHTTAEKTEEAPPPPASPGTPPASGGEASTPSELEDVQARYLRLAADFENFKRRARQDQLDTIQYAAATLAEKLLPVLDDTERALEHAPEGTDETWLKGVKLTFKKLEEVLGSVGVEPIEAVGSRFDPKFHEAIGSEESDEHPDDTVLVELRRGYRMHDRVLRPSLVKVSRRPA